MSPEPKPAMPGIPDDLMLEACRLFFEKHKKPTDIADRIQKELKKRGIVSLFNRQQVYPLLQAAIQRKLIRFHPPLEDSLAEKISFLTRVPRQNIRVVNVTNPWDMKLQAEVATEMLIDIVHQTVAGKRDGKVHLGLGAGHTTMLVAKAFGERLRSEPQFEAVKKLVIHSISSGFLIEEPELAPGAYCGLFDGSRLRVSFVGLFTAAMVWVRDYPKLKRLPGVKEAFARASEIDVVVTSLSNPDSQYGLLNRFEKQYASLTKTSPKAKGSKAAKASRAGDLQYRPYSATEPLPDDPDGFRAVTLFELKDFVEMVKHGKSVLLVSGVSHDRQTKTRALLPLLRAPKLRVWSHLCLDVTTAREVVEELKPKATT